MIIIVQIYEDPLVNYNKLIIIVNKLGGVFDLFYFCRTRDIVRLKIK